MTRQRQGQIGLGHAPAIIPHPDQLQAALLNFDIYARRTGIEAIFNQLLDHRCRPFDHLACSDLVGQARR